MIHEDLLALDATPVGGESRWLAPLIVAAAAASAAMLAAAAGMLWVAGLFALVIMAALAAILVGERRARSRPSGEPFAAPDFALVGAALEQVPTPAALTDRDGALLVVNHAYRTRFNGAPSPLSIAPDDAPALAEARDAAWRDGAACAVLGEGEGRVAVEVERVGLIGEQLMWRFPAAGQPDLTLVAAKRIAGATGERLASAGVLAALVDEDGRVLAANKLFADRALAGAAQGSDAPQISDLVSATSDGTLQLLGEGEGAARLRVVHVPLNPHEEGGAGTLLMFDSPDTPSVANSSNIHVLLEMLPIGLALVDRDGRFVMMNKAFRAAGGLTPEATPAYPGDLVTKEDKAAVADAVRRNARGPAMSADLAVRLNHQPAEPVALTVAGLRGLGEAAVLLLLKDNSEEAKLKRQVAQATKMQAVGQLAGGVAHDFNNILTAIIGHCDLILMRHTPGDSDYDDIQQIKSNSNRAAGLTRQLLAFSRQQTLRPQVLQLPDVVSEVSHLLKRLLGETVQLVVKHGRDVGPVRADPGQLEQVIVNLAVNARDAMAGGGGGTLTIHSYAVKSEQVADLGSDILPVADYSAMSIGDTGTGIAPAVLGKVFEPFFTTKEVGKGTGLGLSTVYGIVKQSGGYIFADSKVGEGTRFTIYLPVHRVEDTARLAKPAKPVSKDQELWGTGTVLLVEDEPMVRTVAERALTRHGYKVLTANNGEEALELLGKTDETIALLISDVVMPLMDGPTMVREARKEFPTLPILFMSGYAEEQLRKSIDIANVAFLPKPFSVQELAEAVRAALAAEARRAKRK